MIKIEISCAMCGKEKAIEIETENVDPGLPLRRIIEEAGWSGQLNGNNFDIYCSKRCAE